MNHWIPSNPASKLTQRTIVPLVSALLSVTYVSPVCIEHSDTLHILPQELQLTITFVDHYSTIFLTCMLVYKSVEKL